MWEYKARDPEAPVPCPYALALRETAQEIFARITETTTMDTFTRCQQSLLVRYWELAERVEQDWGHFPTPRTGRHWCLRSEYEQAYQKLKILYLTRAPAPAPSASQQPPLTPNDVVNNLRASAEKLRRHRDTYLGRDNPLPPQENAT